MSQKKKKVILTGATGVIGAGIIRLCNNLGWEVTAVVRPGSEKNKYIEVAKVHLVPCDLSELELLKEISECQSADYFIHLGWMGTQKASREKKEIQERNVDFAIEACKVAHAIGCSAFVFAGSQAEYGRLEGAMRPDLPTNPISEYGKAKLQAGLRTQALCKEYGMRHIYTRILSVYGPCNEPDTMVMSTIMKLLKGQSPYFTPAEQLWDYLYSDDAARAMLLLAQRGKNNRIYCIGSGDVKPLRSYIEIIGSVVNKDIDLEIGKLPYAENQIMELYADIKYLREDTGFEPRYTFEQGIRLTADWIRQNWSIEE